MESLITAVLFLRPWKPLSDSGAKFFEAELARELVPHHLLHSHRTCAVAITVESDDVLYRLEDGSFAQVHLTHARNPAETVTSFPRTRTFETLVDWMITVMLPDHVDHFGLWDDGW